MAVKLWLMPRLVQRFAPWLVPSALWLWLFFNLHYEWSLNPQYNYGWAVPFLAALLFYLRWPSRPANAAARGGAVKVVMFALLSLLLPVRMIEEANPDWRLLSWTLGLIAVAYSLLTLWREGGIRWLRHFAFPVCFTLVAVPWPVRLENFVVQHLTRAVAFCSVEIAGWIGVGAYRLGNVIELHNGFLGVNEACSGVKTLQAAIMVTLVLGELLQMRISRRVALLASGAAWVFFCNVLRATVLMMVAARSGMAALERWHDLVGTILLVFGLAGLIGIAWLVRENSELPRNAAPANAPSAPRTSLALAFVSLAWLALVFGATELWYRQHETQLVAAPNWRVSWPNESNFHPLPIPEETRVILRYNEAESAVWEDPGAIRWWVFFARWNPGRTALQLVRSHSPEICLPAAGRIFRGELPRVQVSANAVTLQFRAYDFTQSGQRLFVFVAIEESSAPQFPGEVADDWSARGRLRAVWLGKRNLGQRLLEIAVIGYDDFPRARAALIEMVRALVQPNESTG